jgi:hypothetical protein
MANWLALASDERLPFPKVIIFDAALLLQFAALFANTMDDEHTAKICPCLRSLTPRGSIAEKLSFKFGSC